MSIDDAADGVGAQGALALGRRVAQTGWSRGAMRWQ